MCEITQRNLATVVVTPFASMLGNVRTAAYLRVGPLNNEDMGECEGRNDSTSPKIGPWRHRPRLYEFTIL